MPVPRFVRPIIAACCIVLAIGSCTDKGIEPPLKPILIEPPALSMVAGTSRTVKISGGTPPYYIAQYPIPQVVEKVSFEDSTVSPANLEITLVPSATTNDVATIVIGDSDPNTGDDESISITVVPVGNVSYSDDIQPIWDGSCQNRSCHPGGGAPFTLNFQVSYNNLYYVVVSNMSCGAIYRVVPGSPDSSLLYLMISGKTTICPRMPLSPLPGDTLSTSDQGKIREWIEQGAFNN